MNEFVKKMVHAWFLTPIRKNNNFLYVQIYRGFELKRQRQKKEKRSG